jgi:hypothetical protein
VRLRAAGFQNVFEYDLYFHSDPEILNREYDLVYASEVAEHFRNPAAEFRRLRGLLGSGGGKLVLMTLLYTPERDFNSWSYRRDPTHLVFYSNETLIWIAQAFRFDSPEFISERICVLG